MVVGVDAFTAVCGLERTRIIQVDIGQGDDGRIRRGCVTMCMEVGHAEPRSAWRLPRTTAADDSDTKLRHRKRLLSHSQATKIGPASRHTFKCTWLLGDIRLHDEPSREALRAQDFEDGREGDTAFSQLDKDALLRERIVIP